MTDKGMAPNHMMKASPLLVTEGHDRRMVEAATMKAPEVDGLGILDTFGSTGVSLRAPGRGRSVQPEALRAAIRDILGSNDGLRERLGIRPMAEFKKDSALERILGARVALLSVNEQNGLAVALSARLHGREIAMPDGGIDTSVAESIVPAPLP